MDDTGTGGNAGGMEMGGGWWGALMGVGGGGGRITMGTSRRVCLGLGLVALCEDRVGLRGRMIGGAV